jgi:hypothetical protein
MAMLKEGFIEAFGDIAYNTDLIPDLVSETRRSYITTIAPTVGRDEYVDQGAFEIMDEISALVRQFCVESVAPPVLGVPTFDVETFWNNFDNASYAALSVPGFQFARAAGNMFLRSFREEVGPQYGATDCVAEPGPVTGWEIAVRAERTGVTSLLAGNEYWQLVYDFGQRVARARLYAIAQLAYSGLDRLTASASGDSSAARAGQRLILGSLGLSSGESVKAMYEKSLEDLKAYTGARTTKDRNQVSRSSAGSGSVLPE